MPQKRKPGISVLIATQNEEAVVGLCIRSFLDFGDEIVVVDNGSTDHTKDIVRDLQTQYPQRIKFFDRPELPDLYHNRRFALAQSSYEWLVRADADYVAYTEGKYDIMQLREYLLSLKRTAWPEIVYVPQVNIVGDFQHTGVPMRPGGYRANPERAQVSEPLVEPMARFYRHFRCFGFVRRGRRETTRFWRLMKRIYWNEPVWMHCNIKSDMNHFFRSERTNWRELGQFKKFPTLHDYIENIVEKKYGTKNFDEAALLYMERHVLPYLQPYDPEKYYPYPSLVRAQMEKNPIYKIYQEKGQRKRRFLGIDLPNPKGAAAE